MGRLLVFVGIAVAFVGLVSWVFPRAFAWFGNLPGDIRIERNGTRVYVPIGSMIVVSIVLTLVVNFVAHVLDLFP